MRQADYIIESGVERKTVFKDEVRTSKVYRPPLHILFVLLGSIFLSEMLLMLIMKYITGMSQWQMALLDATLLTLLVSPLLYIFLIRRLLLHISERGRAEDDLRKTTVSKDYVDNILYSMHDVLIVTDEEGTIKRVNKAALDALEYSEEELVGQPVEKIFADELSCDAPDIVSRDEIYSTIETDYVTKSGNKIPVVFTSSIMFDKAGKVQGIVCVAQDITERKCMEESLRSSEDYFRSFVESSQDCICNLTVDGRLMSMNPAGCILNDIERLEDATGMSCMVNVAFGREAVEEALRNAAKGAKTSVEYKTISGKGREVWWDCKFAPVVDIDGSIRSILQVSRDISAHKNMEQSLINAQDMLIKEHDELSRLFRQVELSKTEWESTMDCMGDVIILTDRKGKIKRYNKQLLKFTDKLLEEIVGREWEEVMSEIGLETVTFYSGSIELLHRPSRKWFTLNSYPLNDGKSEHSGAVITVHETTEIKNITEELEKAYKELKDTQAQILQREKMASIGQLAAGVAHEINNPMGFITSNLGTLDKYINKLTEYIDAQAVAVASFKSEEAEAGLKEIRKKLKLDYVIEDLGQLIGESLEGAERVKKIVQNLKTFSRIDQAEHKPADINECIESTLNIVWNELKYKTTVEKEYGKLPFTKCYPQQLNQVFMNLLVNAAQAIEKQGTIKIKTWNGDGTINVSISDTGSGIPADKLNKIFDPFFTTKPVGKGTGLGLSITYDIVKKHNGEITVESELGKGTVFNIRIPVVEGK